MARLTTAISIFAALAALAAGCGGGGDDSLSKAEFIEQAEQACSEQKGNLLAKYNAYGEQNASPGDSAADLREKAFEGVQLPVIEAELAAIRELGAPAEGAARLRAFLRAEQRAIAAADDAGDAKSLAEMRRRFDAAAKLADSYGISACANHASGLIGR